MRFASDADSDSQAASHSLPLSLALSLSLARSSAIAKLTRKLIRRYHGPAASPGPPGPCAPQAGPRAADWTETRAPPHTGGADSNCAMVDGSCPWRR